MHDSILMREKQRRNNEKLFCAQGCECKFQEQIIALQNGPQASRGQRASHRVFQPISEEFQVVAVSRHFREPAIIA